MTHSFLDAGVLIAAARGAGDIPARAHAILDDPERGFIASDCPQGSPAQGSVSPAAAGSAVVRNLLRAGGAGRPPSADLMRQAYEDACAFGLSALDALHIAADRLGGSSGRCSASRDS